MSKGIYVSTPIKRLFLLWREYRSKGQEILLQGTAALWPFSGGFTFDPDFTWSSGLGINLVLGLVLSARIGVEVRGGIRSFDFRQDIFQFHCTRTFCALTVFEEITIYWSLYQTL